jgi:hypothetical protein
MKDIEHNNAINIDEEKNEDDNLMTLEGTGEELLEKILDKVEYRYNNKDNKKKKYLFFFRI